MRPSFIAHLESIKVGVIPVAAVMALNLHWVTPSFAQAGAKPAASDAARIKKVEDDILFLRSRVDTFSTSIRSGYARPDCSSKRFGSVQSDDAARFLILVACESIEPYLEGYRIILDIGNPYFATMTQVRGTLLYANHSKRAEIPLSGGLRPGGWTRVTVNIGQAQASEVQRISAEFFVESVSLSR